MKKVIVSCEDLKNNLKTISKILDENQTKTKIIAVVKGNGMGLGLIEYAKFLVDNGIEMLAVANIEEAISLRQSEIEQEILMLTPTSDENELTQLIENNITLTISSLKQIEIVEEIAKTHENEIKAHIKIDTGFARYGFLYENEKEILEAFEMCDKIKITGTYTHFASPMDEKVTKKQFERFLNIINVLGKEGKNPGLLHVSESTAFLKYPEMNLDAVRLGSVLQGRTLINVEGLKKIGALKANIQEIKTVPKGYNISYGNMYKTKKETKIAVVPVGYMDGFNMRKDRDIFSFKENFLSVGIEIKKFFKDNKLKVIIKDKKYNIIGRIGMYHCVVDITESQDLDIGDEVTFEILPMKVNSIIRREYV